MLRPPSSLQGKGGAAEGRRLRVSRALDTDNMTMGIIVCKSLCVPVCCWCKILCAQLGLHVGILGWRSCI